MNPYSFFAGGRSSVFYNSIGHFLVLTSSFAGFTAIYIIAPGFNIITFLLLVLYSMSVILQLHTLLRLYGRLASFIKYDVIDADPLLSVLSGSLGMLMSKEDLTWYFAGRVLMTFLSLVVGVLIFFICNSYKGTL